MSNEVVTDAEIRTQRKRPAVIHKVSRFEEARAMHLEVTRLANGVAPKVPLPNSHTGWVDETLIALHELRAGKLDAIVHRDGESFPLVIDSRDWNTVLSRSRS
jgi:hypothetical protein